MARKIKTILELDNGNFRRGIQQADRDVDKLKGNFVRMAKLTAAALLGLGAAISAVVVKQTALGAKIADTSQKLGVSTGFLQEFRYAAQQVGVTVEAADKGLQRFTRSISESAIGMGAAKDDLNRLGVQLTSTNGRMRATEDILNDVAEGLKNTESETDQLRIAIRLFGQEGAGMINMLKGGAQGLNEFRAAAQRAGVVVSDSAIKNMKAFDDSMTDVKLAVSALAAEFVGSLAPQLKLLAETTLLASDANKELARQMGVGLGEAIRAVAASVKFLVEWWREFITVLELYVALNVVRVFASMMVSISATTKAMIANVAATRAATVATAGLTKAGAAAAKSTGTLTKSMGLLRVAIMSLLGPVGIVIVGFGALVAGMTIFKDNTLQLGDTTSTVGETIQAVWWKIKDVVFNVIKSIGSLFKKSQDDIKDEIDGGLVASFANAFGKIINSTKITINVLIGLFIGLFTTIYRHGKALPGIFVATFSSVGAVISDFVSRTKDQFGQLFDYIISLGRTDVTNSFSGMFAGIGEIIEREFAGVMPQGVNLSELISRDYLGETADFVKNQLGGIVEEYRNSKKAIEQLGDLTEVTPQGKKAEKSTFVDKGLEDSLARIREAHEQQKRILSQNLELSRTFNETQREILQARFDIENKYHAMILEARIQFGNKSDGELEKELARIQKQKDLETELQDKLNPVMEKQGEVQRSFSEGWSKALGEFGDRVSNEAEYAQRIIDTMSQGFTDAIMTFVETGKLSFKDLFKTLLQEIIKMQANKMFLSLFGGGAGGTAGLLSGLFGGGKAKGGSIIGGRAYMVGEKGPEMIVPSGSGTVVPNDMLGGDGGQQVTYNINAVDAMSFKQMVSRDPEFIHSVAQRGARRLPR